jgi:hypothetical protein
VNRVQTLKVLVDSNTFTDLPNAVQPDGNGFATFGGARVSERLSFSRNLYQGMFNGENVVDGTYPHEAFTSDGNGGAYAGVITSASHNTVTVPKPADPNYIGAVLAVVSGAGQGQSLRVVAAHVDTYTVEGGGFAVPLDQTSVIVVAPYVGKVLVRCSFFERGLHSRMPLSFTPLLCLKCAAMRVINGIALGCSLLLPTNTVNSVQCHTAC